MNCLYVCLSECLTGGLSVSLCTGSHWERRLVSSYEDLMSPDTDRRSSRIVSPMLLAVFQDSGWYNADFSKAGNTYTKGAHKAGTRRGGWGKG